ncbi:MAG: efflux RND transporter periplasmic adaptor subunit [Pseudomonadota bacterium]|nr:efflux RND transporter periplasmic adaptor subunit [Pseudomonadota bacterium]
MPIHSPFSAIGVLALVLALSACRDNEAAPSGAADRSIPVTTQRVQLRQWNDTVQALGTVKARESVTVTAKVSETVRDVHFASGDVVQRGAPLVTLTGQSQQAELVAAQAAANEAQQLFRRQSELASQQLIARSSLDSQRAIRDAGNARVAQIRAQLADRVIRAPFSGVLGMRQVSPGALVTPGTAIATLDDTVRVYVDFPVPETLLSVLEEGQELSGTSAAYPGMAFPGTVSSVDSRIDPATRAVTVRGEFANPERALRPGMLMQITQSQPARDAMLVPEIAIVQVGSSSYVYRVKEDSTVEQAAIAVGARRDGMAEVTSGLEVGERIVIDGTGKLRIGSRISEDAASTTTPPPRRDQDQPVPDSAIPPQAVPRQAAPPQAAPPQQG